jgi:hypothetical protein
MELGLEPSRAPLTAFDPTADDTDVYAFTAPGATGATGATGGLTIVANWIPFEDPAGGPNLYRFDAHPGFDAQLKRIEPTHPPTPADPTQG